MSGNLKLNTALGGSIALTPENTASNITVTIPATTGTLLTTATAGVPIGGPAFSAYATTATSCANNVFAKILFNTEEFDTNNNFSSSRFTPTVAGYYQLNASINMDSIASTLLIGIFKNGSEYKRGVWAFGAALNSVSMSASVYCNGSTDYVELYIYQNTGSSINTATGRESVWFDGCLVRSAT
jgi:hypothetical protein